MEVQKKWYTLTEAAKELRMSKVTLYEWMERLSIKKHMFIGNRKRYLSADEVARIREVLINPSKAGEKP